MKHIIGILLLVFITNHSLHS